jgi:hypothetical protein
MRLGCLGLIALATTMANARELNFGPSGSDKRLASPDGSKILYGVPFNKTRNAPPQLWIEDTRTHKRTKLFDILRDLSAGWSPDGAAFYVNDFQGSDETDAYLYDATTLERLDLDARIQASDPASRRFAHTYYEVTRWVGNQEVAVRFHGHTDEPPVTDFEFRYRVSRAGVVKQLSHQTAPVKD